MPDNADDQKYTVTGKIANVDLTQMGDSIKLLVLKRGVLFGKFYIGRGSLKWVPEGKQKLKAEKITWGQLAKMLEERQKR